MTAEFYPGWCEDAPRFELPPEIGTAGMVCGGEVDAEHGDCTDADAGVGRRRFRFIDDEELENQPTPDWLVEGMVACGSFVLIVGEPGSMKSFLALDLAASIGTGKPWAGRAVKPGLVVYVLAEGGGLFSLRTRAWRAHHDIAGPLGLQFLPQPVQLADRTDVSHVLSAIARLSEPPRAVIFDTLARCAVGVEENSARDIGRLIEGVDQVRIKTGATTILLHHTPRGGDRERGSVALRAATDTQLLVSADGDFITVECQRQKDIDEGAPLNFRKRVLDLGEGRSSCVLVPVSDSELTRPPRGMGDLHGSGRKLIEALRAARGPMTSSQLEKATGLRERTYYRALRNAKDKRLVEDAAGRLRLSPAGEALFRMEAD